MRFEILGPLVARRQETLVRVGGPREHKALAVLLLAQARPVSTERLAAALWGVDPPATARAQIHNCVAMLRRALGPQVGITRSGGGFTLDLSGHELDLAEFHALIADADMCVDPLAAVRQYRTALGLWRGPVLDRLTDGALAATASQLQEKRLTCLERCLVMEVQLGSHTQLSAELVELVAEYPLRESLVEIQMRVLCRAGRRADALATYADTRKRLADELGVDPSPVLQRLHTAILRDQELPQTPNPANHVGGRAQRPEIHDRIRTQLADEPNQRIDLGLANPGGGRAVQRDGPMPETPELDLAPAAVPRELPAAVGQFVGRVQELAALNQVDEGSTVRICVIDGMAGVGKSALAIHAAHQLANRYPDGQIFLDLCGYTQGMRPIEPTDALDQMLRKLGIPGPQIPPGVDARAALYRTQLANRRMLIVLDNAATEPQVVPLLPGSPGCQVLITSRRRLAGLDHTCGVSLNILPTHDAVTLFTLIVGEGRLDGQPPGALVELVELCGRLPLAIRIAAAKLRSHPAWDLTALAERLRDQRHRLGELEAGHRSVTATLDVSYQQLNPTQQQAYRRIGLHPGRSIDAYATAALLASTVQHATQVLDQLLDAHLLLEPFAARYRLHDLILAHASQRVASSDATDGEVETAELAAQDRLLDYYRHTASVAIDAAYPDERGHCPQISPVTTPTPCLADPAQAVQWLDTELENLLAAAEYAARHNRLDYVLHLSTILHGHLHARGRYRDSEKLYCHALTAAGATGQQAGQLEALIGLGRTQWLQGLNGQAIQHLMQALQIAYAIGDRTRELNALIGLGHLRRVQGHYQQATDHFDRALEIARTADHRAGEINALTGLAWLHVRQGLQDQAAKHFGQALEIARVAGHCAGEINALNGLGHLYRVQGHNQQATDHFEQALQIAHTMGHRAGELTALNGLGHLHRMQGHYQQAIEHYHNLRAAAEQDGDRNIAFEAWQGLGRLHHATGRHELAIAHHLKALTLASSLDQPDDQARAHDGIAHGYHALHQQEKARQHWQRALSILTDLGIDHTEDDQTTVAAIRSHLAGLGQHQRTGALGPVATRAGLPPR